MVKPITVTMENQEPIQVHEGITLYELAKSYASQKKYPILLAKVNNELQELSKRINEDSAVQFLDITDPNGFRAYQRGVVFLLVYAAKDVLGKEVRVIVEHSINKNYYCEIPMQADETALTVNDGKDSMLTEAVLETIENRMREMAEKNVPIEKHTVTMEQAIRCAREFGLLDKIENLKYRRTSNVNLYKLDWFYDYFYGQMVPSTGYLGMFRLHKHGGGFMLQFPDAENPGELAELKVQKKVSQVFSESNHWARILKVDTVGALNDTITRGGIGDIVRISEALHEKKIAQMADMIDEQKKTIVLIAGPSSSGKTTFAERLCIQLRVNGLRPYVISLDNYYVNNDQTPRDKNGKPDFECLEAIDVAQINIDLQRLLAGETVDMPTFDFKKGKREYRGNFLQLREGDVLLMEGIHGLNEKVSESVPKKDKFKIFISALTQLNMDDHNRIPTTDTRLIRRLVRDYHFRGASAQVTIAMWPDVTDGEGKYIFPFQEDADAFFNSALVYEMCILKQYAEPLLFQIDKTQPEYTEARRMVKFLDSFLGVSSEIVPPNSILREFIGGSCFQI